MHEVGLAMRIMEMVEEHAASQGPAPVTRIELELGELSGVMHESLLFALRMVVQASRFPAAGIVIHRLRGAGVCKGCGHGFPLELPRGTCPRCGRPDPEVVRGREFRLKSIRIGPSH